jgi:hypothetical protein
MLTMTLSLPPQHHEDLLAELNHFIIPPNPEK